MRLKQNEFVEVAKAAWEISGIDPDRINIQAKRVILYEKFYEEGQKMGFDAGDLRDSLGHIPYQRILLYPLSNIAGYTYRKPAIDRNGNHGNHRYYIPSDLGQEEKLELLRTHALRRAGLNPDYDKTPENSQNFYLALLQTIGENKSLDDVITYNDIRQYRKLRRKAAKERLTRVP
ncbi:MAG: hypothetical protein HY514_02745 [Candidatus Aenigmarchaeota archaeon]|nr:hypothetical protein [Candidatus Aenigmarchaeota archaeon]